MKKRIIYLLILACTSGKTILSQTIYVDPVKGKQNAVGTQQDPVSTIHEAVALVSNFSGKKPVTIKLYPGLYLLTDQVELNSFGNNDTISYTIEAAVMPDDKEWLPASMPVIQSVSRNNKNWKSFDHCTGFQVQRNNTAFKGLKFVGNANPAVVYYYAIERHFPDLKGMNISQCIFVGNRNAAPIQGALFAQGPGIKVDHCIFYECKNAVLAFMSVTGFSFTNSIVYGSYEGAIWFGKYADFVFDNNIISNNKCFWIGMADYTPQYRFSNSVITDNTIFLGLNKDGVIEEDKKNKPILNHVQQSGKVSLTIVTTDTIPKRYLHVAPGSAGYNHRAGIFTGE